MNADKHRSESELAKTVIDWLQDWGWDVYQEVQVFAQGSRADIVAVMGLKIWVIETKLTHSFDVLEQALAWRWLAHYSSVAVPHGRHKTNHIREMIHRSIGVGLIRVGHDCDEIIGPQMNRQAQTHYIRDVLCEEHKRLAEAGSNTGGYFTSFASTKKRLIELIGAEPGLTMKEIIARMGRAHYASTATARTALSKWITKGVIQGIVRRRSGRSVTYWPESEQIVNHKS